MSETCSNQNGEFVCQTIKNLQRVCPGRRTETILRKNIQRSGDKYSANEFESPFGQGGDSGFGMFNDSQLFQFAEDILGSFLGSFGGGAPIVRDPSSGGYSQPALPPHKVLPNLDGNTKAPGQVVRRVEDI
eukprot:scaffold15944_cov248-Ochromonas_danica.AAC.2